MPLSSTCLRSNKRRSYPSTDGLNSNPNSTGRRRSVPLPRAGFFMVDTQVAFRIALKPVTGACANELTVRSARDAGFSFHESNMAPFERERYAYLPGCTTSLINERYAMWARSMIRDRPDTCLAVSAGEEVQGWFFSLKLHRRDSI